MINLALKDHSLGFDKAIIWDSVQPAPKGYNKTILWRTFLLTDDPNLVSIPSLVEENASELKARYLSWVYELGQTRIGDKSLVDKFEIFPEFSYWWMTLFVEKSNFSKSPKIIDAIRFIALTDWISVNAIKSITFASDNIKLVEILCDWCKARNILFEWQDIQVTHQKISWHYQIYNAFPFAFRAILWLIHYLFQYWCFRGIGTQQWRVSKGRIAFVSYLLKTDAKTAVVDEILNQYWGSLPGHLNQDGHETNWLHIYVKDSLSTSAIEGVEALKRLNIAAEGRQSHVALQSFLSISVVLRALFIWVQVIWIGFRSRSVFLAEKNLKLSVNLFPLFIDDWNESVFGPIALENALNLSLFQRAFECLPKQNVGVFLQENQGWEFGCIHAWKSLNHGRLIGCPHSTVRFWDLRYFFDPRTYTFGASNPMPRPDFVALNSGYATTSYLNGGYPSKELVQVEALRYLYLENLEKISLDNSAFKKEELNLLVLGDYKLSNTRNQLELLEKVMHDLPFKVLVTAKSHPACPINLKDFPQLKMSVTTEPLDKVLRRVDAAYVSATTSAAIDAYCYGLPIISVLDPNSLNMSPLRRFSGVSFVWTQEQFTQSLLEIKANGSIKAKRQYFILDAVLTRWRKLLRNNSYMGLISS